MAEMQPGRDMDAAVARVIGWRHVRTDVDGPHTYIYYARMENEHEFTTLLPHFSISDADALTALDAVLAKQQTLRVRILLGGPQVVVQAFSTNHSDRIVECGAATRAEAICRAILALAEVDHAT